MIAIDFGRTHLGDPAKTFIATFLRLEFALKEARLGRATGDAAVKWTLVADALGPDFIDDVRTSQIAPTLLTEPPKQQVAKNHELSWKEQKPPKDTLELLDAVARVRNNLFHGGKSNDPEFDASGGPSRSTTLITEAQRVIELVLEQLDEVRMHFEGKY